VLTREGGNAKEVIRDSMAKGSEVASRFSRLRARLKTAAAKYGAAPEKSFEFGLQAILDEPKRSSSLNETPAD